MIETGRYLLGAAGASGFGSKSTAEEVTENCYLRSTTALITGATSGIGAETARVLAKRGARLIFPARNVKAAEEAKERIVYEFPETEIVVMELDLSSIASVRSFVADFESLDLPLNLLINNAGKLAHEHAISEDGIEMTFATNYLGHFLLTSLLLKKMIQTAAETGVQGRIVNVTSGIHGWFSGDLIEYLRLISQPKCQFDATRAYALSKLANVLHTKELSSRLQKIGANVTVNCVHPGVVKTRLTRDRDGLLTDLVFFLASKLVKTVPQAAATTCYVATNPRLVNVSGKYFTDCNETTPSGLGSNSSEATKLWAASEILTAENGKLVKVRVCPHTLTWTATSKMLSTHYVGPTIQSNGSDSVDLFFGENYQRRHAHGTQFHRPQQAVITVHYSTRSTQVTTLVNISDADMSYYYYYFKK